MNPPLRGTFSHSRAEKITDKCCRVCGFHRDIEAHHLVHRAKIGSKHPAIHNANNLIPLCHGCHQHHHTTVHGRVPRRFLTDAEILFIETFASPAWLDRWYPTDPPEEL